MIETKIKRLSLRKAILTLYTLLMVCMGAASFMGQGSGATDGSCIYGAWWFSGLWAILVVLSLLFLIRKKVHRRRAVMLLHLAFVVILAGALVTHLTAKEGTIHLRQGENVSHFTDKQGTICQLPFSLTLTAFDILYYPGTDAIMDYQCRITCNAAPSLKGGRGESLFISMNHIGRVQGYRFYQSAYDSDGAGSQLLVAYDPYGIALTYTGYVLLLIGLLWTLCSKRTRIRELYRQATKPIALLLCLLPTLSAKAETRITPVNKEIADELCSVAVHYNGRICPLGTAANDFVTKLCGKASWQGYSANEIFVGWMIYYTEWESQRLVKIKSREVQQLLGIDGKWASVRDFYTPSHAYKLSPDYREAGKGASKNSVSARGGRNGVREADEKLQVVTMFYNSEMLHIFPLKSDGRLTWHAPGSTELPLGTPEAEFQFINHAMDRLTACILADDVEEAKTIIAKIKLYQKEKAGDVMPSPTKLRAELFYNKLQQAHWPVYLFLTLSLLLCPFALTRGSKMARRLQIVLIPLATLWLTTLLALRWWISGHVPMSNGPETMLFMAWVTLLITLATARRMPVLLAMGPVVSAFCMLVATIAMDTPQVTNLMPVLQSPLLSIHVAVVMLSYALLAMTMLLAVYGLVLHRRRRVAELQRTTALSKLLLYPAVALLAIGIFVGAVWANVSWGSYWSWDPKETWALITLMIYAVPLHRSFLPDSKEGSALRHHLYVLLSFLTVMMTYFGVNFFLSGMHSYA